jgi:hypothetical protein
MSGSVEQLLQGLSARLPRLLRWSLGIVSVMLIVLFCISAAERVRAPFELEEHEGYAVESIGQIADGGSLYSAPSFTFVPYLYAPGYYYTAAAVVRAVHHNGFSVARSISIASTLGAFAMIFLLVWRETESWLPSLAAAALYAGAYPLCESWFDIARLDSFYVLVLLCAIYATRWMHPVFAALVWVAVVQVKQPMLPAALVMLCWDWRRVGRTLAGLFTFSLVFAATVVAAMKITSHWYGFYAFTVPRAVSGMILRPLVLFPFSKLFAPFGIACILLASAAWLIFANGISRTARFYLFSLSLFLVTWVQMGHTGSSVNVLMPMYALLGVLFGFAIFRLQSLPWRGMPELVMLAAAIQLAGCIYNPGQWKGFPYADPASAAALMSLLHTTPGDVYVVWHPYYGIIANKPEHTDYEALKETLQGLSPTQADALQTSIASALCENTTALVIDAPDGPDVPDSVFALGALLHRGDGWNKRFTEPHIIPGANPHFRPSWVAYAQGGSTAAMACMQPAP